jgi:hypothetical protein
MAIAEASKTGGYLVVPPHTSVADAKKRAQEIYPGLSQWVKSGVGKKQAERFLDRLFGSQRCKSCGRRPDQVRQLVSKRKLLVCDRCIRELLEMLEEDGDDPSRSQKL